MTHSGKFMLISRNPNKFVNRNQITVRLQKRSTVTTTDSGLLFLENYESTTYHYF